MKVTERIEMHMAKRGWTRYRLGKESGLSQSTLAHVFREDSEPTISTLETICSTLGVTMSQFFAEGDLVALTEEQKELLERWGTLTPRQKKLILELMENMQ